MMGKGYPLNTFLFRPDFRFTDFRDTIFVFSLPNPYADPNIVYLPFSSIFFRPFAYITMSAGLIICIFTSLACLTLLLNENFRALIPNPWKRMGYSLMMLGTAFPMLMCIDRGNVEILLAPLVALSLYFFSRCRYALGMLFLLSTISLKLYPILLLALLLRQRKLTVIAWCMALFFTITALSFKILALPLETLRDCYHRAISFYFDWYVYENHSLEASASLWNAYKLGLIMASNLGLISPIDFSFNSPFIIQSYTIYSMGMAFLALLLVIHVCFVEREFLRCAALLLLFISMSAPSGGDYRLLYAGIALVTLILVKTRRINDLSILILVALTMVPKKEFLLPFVGQTESQYPDVSIQVLLNPFCIFAAMGLLLYDGLKELNLKWSCLRLSRLRRAAFSWLPSRNQRPPSSGTSELATAFQPSPPS